MDRLPASERLELLPILLPDFGKEVQHSTKNAAILFNLILKLLHSLKFPERGSPEDQDLRERFHLGLEGNDAKVLAESIGKLILFVPSRTADKRSPGLNTDEYDFLQLYGKEETWLTGQPGALNLADTKLAALRFIASGAFTEEERFFPALFASADANSRISDVGDDLMKRALPAVSIEDDVIVKKLLDLYLGSGGPQGTLSSKAPLQMKILKLLSRSERATSFVSETLKIVQLGLLETSSSQTVEGTSRTTKGRESAKLKTQIFAFVNWLARIGSPSDLASFAPEIIAHVRDFIEGQGWPRPRSEEPLNANELQSRSYGYESIGLLAAACPDKVLIEPDIELLRWLMTSLSEDPCGGETSLSIDHALSSVIGSFARQSNAELSKALASLLLHHMSLTPNTNNDTSDGIVRSTRFISLRFANRCLPYDNVDARYMDVLALCTSGKERNELLEEGKKGLHPYWNKVMNPGVYISMTEIPSDNPEESNLPPFTSIVQRLLGPESDWNLDLPNMASALNSTLSFCRSILMQYALESAGSAPKIDADWERNIDAVVRNTEDTKIDLRRVLSTWIHQETEMSRALQTYMQKSFELLTTRGPIDGHIGGQNLVEILSLLDIGHSAGLTHNVDRLQTPLFSSRKDIRTAAAHVYGLLVSSPSQLSSKLASTIDQRLKSWDQAIGSVAYETHGSILAKAFALSRTVRRGSTRGKVSDHWSKFVEVLGSILDKSKDDLLIEAVFSGIGELSLYAVPDSPVAMTVSKNILQLLIEKCKKGNEHGIVALGRIAMHFDEELDSDSTTPKLASESGLQKIVDALCGLHEVRRPEAHFAVGEALSCAALGWDSSVLLNSIDIEGPRPLSAPRNHTLAILFNKIISDCKSSKPSLRQATVIWLLCLIQFCGHHDVVQKQLPKCQAAFKGFLTDRDSLNQETASRGLTLIYEKGSKSLRDDLVRDLVTSFTGTGSNLAGTVSEDTELFDAGALPTGDGSIRTYKDIMSLASEVGDSSLVYRFMTLASHDAIWSSRAAFGKFGLSNILSDASTDGWLSTNPKIYPALYRYRFDPNTNVRAAMNDIWTAVVKDPATTINTHFDVIIKDLFKNILGKEWRTRQASCAALGDLLQGRPLETYEKYLSETWSLTFKVCDDIKESVRTAAMSLARVLTGILTRSLEGGDTSRQTADAMLKQVLPFLLSTQGLESSAPDVQDFSRQTILQIIKKGQAKTLRPFVPNLVERLLLLLSSIEPEMINYVHMNAEQFGTTKQELDDARLKHIRGSTMLESIEKCLDYLDGDSMPLFETHLVNAIKAAIGLPSKVGCSRVLVSLSTRQNFIFQPYADNFLSLALKQVQDRNDTISSAYAASCGYLARLATDNALETFVNAAQKLYFESEEERQRAISGDLMYACSKYATDRFNSFASSVYPFVFVAKHDQSARAGSLFEDTWNENVGGSRAVLLYLKEIVALVNQSLDSARWSVKHTSAYAIADVVKSAGSNISDADTKTLWPALEKALAGKTWDGKEKVFEALVSLVQHSKFSKTDPSLASQTHKIFLREMKRNNAAYRQHAFKHASKFVAAQDATDFFDEIASIVSPVIEELCDDTEAMDVDSSATGPSSKTLKDLTLAHAISALLAAAPRGAKTLSDWQARLLQCLTLVERVLAPDTRTQGIQVAIHEGFAPLFQALSNSGKETSKSFEGILANYIKTVFDVQDQVEQVRTKAAEAAVTLAGVVKERESSRKVFVEGVKQRKEGERSVVIKQILDKALKALD